jgi:hypothetical protein
LADKKGWKFFRLFEGTLATHLVAKAKDRRFDAPSCLRFDLSAYPGGRLTDVEQLRGKAGWARIGKLRIVTSAITREHIVLSVVADDGGTVHSETFERLFRVPATNEPVTADAPATDLQAREPADEKGDEAQLLPPVRNGETAQLQDPKIEDKETRPPPRYNEGTLIEAMQNAWRFVDDEVLRDRLKEAKGIGTPATRAEIIGGLKKQGFLIAQGKNIVPTETGLSLFGVLKQADPALVDPGVTAHLECLLDDVVVGKQEMVGAIDAVCDVAERIISRLKEGATAGGPSLLGSARGNGTATYAPTPAMTRVMSEPSSI